MKPRSVGNMPDEVHVHYLAQSLGCSYQWIYEKYGRWISEKGMIQSYKIKECG